MTRHPAQPDSAAAAPVADAPAASAVRPSDAALVELLRAEIAPGVGELAESLGVTATAVRQRLERLMRDGVVAREVVRGAGEGQSARPRGRPAFVYRLTEKGRRAGGDNFRDLAMVLWREVRSVASPDVRRGLVSRIGAAMAELYRPHIAGATVAERLDGAAGLLRSRDIACSVTPAEAGSGRLAVLTSHVCPYPDLAEEDRGICAAERLMLQELVGAGVRLASCRLDGADTCRFEVAAGGCDGAAASPRSGEMPPDDDGPASRGHAP